MMMMMMMMTMQKSAAVAFSKTKMAAADVEPIVYFH